jgi:hypothetical protein
LTLAEALALAHALLKIHETGARAASPRSLARDGYPSAKRRFCAWSPVARATPRSRQNSF